MKLWKSFFISVSILSLCFALSSCVSSNTRKVIKQIDNIGVVSYDSDDVLDSIENAYQALSEEEKADVHNYQVYEAARERLKDATIEHLQAEAKSKALTLVREKIKQSLKSPQSYNEYSCEAEPPIILEDSAECSMIIKIKYGATNSFGAEVTKSVSALVSFSVDMENKSVSITDSFIM